MGDYYKAEEEKAKWRQETYRQIVEEMSNNKAILDELAPYGHKQTEEYIEDYAREKVSILEFGPWKIKRLEREDLVWINDAFERLEEIQQKKLFDLQCLWRAEQVELPGIRIAADFKYWEKHILQCPYLEPVSADEVEMYIQYIRGNNFEYFHDLEDGWQDHESIKEAYNGENENRDFPEWYDFYNGRTGKSIYMLLPDIRGQKEEVYMQLWRDKYINKKQTPAIPPKTDNTKDAPSKKGTEKDTAAAPQPVVQDTRPSLNYWRYGFLTWFVQTFESKEMQEKFFGFGGEKIEHNRDHPPINDIIDELSIDAEVFGIESWYDWHEGMERCLDKYRAKKIEEAMPEAYEQYCMHISMGLGFPDNKPEDGMDTVKGVERMILEGRELAGEPRDFDF